MEKIQEHIGSLRFEYNYLISILNNDEKCDKRLIDRQLLLINDSINILEKCIDTIQNIKSTYTQSYWNR